MFQVRRSNREATALPYDVVDVKGRNYGCYPTEEKAKRRARDLEKCWDEDSQRSTKNNRLNSVSG